MSLATSYAKALYAAAKDAHATSDTLDHIENQMDSFGQILQLTDARKALLGPVVTIKEKSEILLQIGEKAGYAKLFTQFLILLASKGRLPAFADIRDAFSTVRLEAEGGVAGRLVSAEPIDDADVQGLAGAFGRKLGKKVAFRVSTDPSLLAGMKVTVNGVTYDGSLRSQLQQLRDRLVAGLGAS
jgi:ATP synthase F1 delta subunit